MRCRRTYALKKRLYLNTSVKKTFNFSVLACIATIIGCNTFYIPITVNSPLKDLFRIRNIHYTLNLTNKSIRK